MSVREIIALGESALARLLLHSRQYKLGLPNFVHVTLISQMSQAVALNQWLKFTIQSDPSRSDYEVINEV